MVEGMRVGTNRANRGPRRGLRKRVLGATVAGYAAICPVVASARGAASNAPGAATVNQLAAAPDDTLPSDSGATPLTAAEWVWQGVAAFDQGDYRAAIASFERAYELEANADLSFNLARSWARLGDCGTAQVHLQRYRNQVTEPPPEFFEGLEAMKLDCPAAPLDQGSGASTTELGVKPAQEEMSTPVEQTERVEPTRDAQLGANPLHAPDRHPVDSSTRNTWAYGLFAAGGVSAVAAVAYSLSAAATRDDLETLAQDLSVDPSRTWDDASRDLITRREHQENLALSFGVAAAALESVGLLLFLAPWEDGDQATAGSSALRSVRVGGDGHGFWCAYQGAL